MHFLTSAFFRRRQRLAWTACGLAAWLFLAAATLADVRTIRPYPQRHSFHS
jgi:hypothetical protein